MAANIDNSKQFQPSQNAIEPNQPTDDGRRNPRRVKGLPELDNLLALAGGYLDAQGTNWPELKGTNAVPRNQLEARNDLAARFIHAFGCREVQPLRSLRGIAKYWQSIGISYVRYSSLDRQDPKSLDDQLFLQLKRAKEDGVFIPWERVFTDAGVSGSVNERTGYCLTKRALSCEGDDSATTLYVDEISRATRVDEEVLHLGNLELLKLPKRGDALPSHGLPARAQPGRSGGRVGGLKKHAPSVGVKTIHAGFAPSWIGLFAPNFWTWAGRQCDEGFGYFRSS